MSVFESKCYIKVIESRFVERSKSNDRYSLRAFARDLQISPSRLSELFNGKGNLSKKFIPHISERLKFTDDERDYFEGLYQLAKDTNGQNSQNVKAKLLGLRLKNAYFTLEDRDFAGLNYWWDYTILAMVNLDRVKPTIEFFSNVLGISEIEAASSFRKLLNMNLIIEEENGFKARSPFFCAGDQEASAVIRKFHTIMIARAKDCIDLFGLDERYLFSVIFTGNRENYENKCKQIQEFANSISDDSADRSQNNQVFGFSLQLFPLSTEF